MSQAVFPCASQAPFCFCIAQMGAWGYPLDEVLLGSGLTGDSYALPETVPDSRQEQAVYENIQRLYRGGAAGLELGRLYNVNSVGVLGALLANAIDLGHAGYLARRFYPLSNPWIVPELISSVAGGQSVVRYRQVGGLPALYRFLIDRDILATRQLLRDIFGASSDGYVCTVAFGYPAPEDAARYPAEFDCPVSFGHDHTYVTYDNELGRLSNARRNPHAYHLYLQLCRETQAQRAPLSWQGRVNGILLCIDFYPNAAAMAKKLNCSERSLRRHLGEEGVQYSELVDKVRFDRAVYLLSHSGDSIKTISFKLFYSEPPAFVRAFARWSGTTPSEFRAALGR
ncbi:MULTISPECIES: AraC family transcriptional regulator [Pseudomonas]|uniref:AraC family transcriptional regulator n=1 Tax=Pseudomonas TaxID=286 RepID=UPI0015543862|nr:AraC family transcriptional regulator [Pseudomonas tumuqii]